MCVRTVNDDEERLSCEWIQVSRMDAEGKKKQFDKSDNPEDERRQEALKMATKHKTKHNLFPVSRSNDTHIKEYGKEPLWQTAIYFYLHLQCLAKDGIQS